MSAAHKNESPVAAGQVVKTISKHTADFIARAASPEHIAFIAFAMVVLNGFVARLGVLQ